MFWSQHSGHGLPAGQTVSWHFLSSRCSGIRTFYGWPSSVASRMIVVLTYPFGKSEPTSRPRFALALSRTRSQPRWRRSPRLTRGCFDSAKKAHRRIFDDAQQGYDDAYSDGMYNVALRRWMSSPEAFRSVVRKTRATKSPDETGTLPLEGLAQPDEDLFGEPVSPPKTGFKGYEAEFRMSQSDRSSHLKPLLSALDRSAVGTGNKAKRLAKELRVLARDGLKAVVFVTELETALSLVKQMRRRASHLRVVTTVERRKGAAKLKHCDQRAILRQLFSPRSHGGGARARRPTCPHLH